MPSTRDTSKSQILISHSQLVVRKRGPPPPVASILETNGPDRQGFDHVARAKLFGTVRPVIPGFKKRMVDPTWIMIAS